METNTNRSLQKKIEELNDRVERSTLELEQLSSKLLDAESQRSNFLSHILNEINNPLTSILGLTKSIVDSAYKDPELVRKQANLAYEEAFELDYKMRNVFAAAKIEAGSVMVRAGNVNVENIIDSILQDLHFKYSRKHLKVEKSVEGASEASFHTDGSLLHTILLNLIGNAVEFSPPKQVLKVDLQLSSARMLFAITDEGPGLNEADRQTIFGRFKQLEEGTTKTHPGTGLGLSIIREYTDMLGGELSIKSRKEEGSTFILVLPAISIGTELENPEEVSFGEEEIF